MNREKCIDYFLKQYVDLYTQNPELEINMDTFYSGLASYGLPKEEKVDKNVEHLFDVWINHFNSPGGLHAYRHKRQKGFLQFENKLREEKVKYGEFVKLYLNFNKENFCECVIKVFDFIQENGISSYSKVADSLRSDSVVLRLDDMEQAKSVINYVNNDKFLVENSRPVNPFLASEGIFGIAFDGFLSYNAVLAKLLERFFRSEKYSGTLNEINAKSFQEYVSYIEKDAFEDSYSMKKWLEEFKEVFGMQDCGEGIEGIITNNCFQIINLIERSLNEGYGLSEYEETYNKFAKEIKNSEMNVGYENFMSDDFSRIILGGGMTMHDDNDRQLLNDYIVYAAQKYGPDMVYGYLSAYMDGSLEAITRDNGFRKRFHTTMSRGKIVNITSKDLNRYIMSVLRKNQLDGNLDESNNIHR